MIEESVQANIINEIDKSLSYLTHNKHQSLYDSLLNSLILNDDIARGQAESEKVLRKRDRDNENPSARPNQGKKTKRSRTKESEPSKKSSTSKETSKGKYTAKNFKASKSMTIEEPIEETVFKMASNDIEQTINDVANDPWFNQMMSAAKDPLTFNELMATPINFSKYSMKRLNIDNLTQAYLVGLVYELLKGTCISNIELKYNMEECFKEMIDKLNWNNPKGYRFPFDLIKPLPLKGRLDYLTVAMDCFFNNNLEFLKSSAPKKKYTMFIMETKAARQIKRNLPRDIPLDRIEVLRHDTKGVKVRKGKMQTKTELALEQTQQGVSDKVLVCIEEVEDLKRNVKIKGKKKEALLTLR
nr:hypothetical protein [Tanacetum cinerariifolium]